MDYLIKSKPLYMNLNVCTGIGTSVLEMLKAFEKVNEVKVPYFLVDRRKGDMPSVVGDNSFSISVVSAS